MRALLLTTGLMTLVACAPEAAGEDLFEVVGAVPDDGGEADAATRLELRLSASGDAEACTEDTLGVVALTDEGFVGFEVPLSIEWMDDGNKAVLVPDSGLAAGYTYAYAVRSGTVACLDVDGRPLQPFYAEFTVR